MYSILLYMKTRVTFRVAEDLAEALKGLPNQTHFVETVLREALGMTCPVCEGSGRVPSGLRVPNFKQQAWPALDPAMARQLRSVVQLGRRLAATTVDLEPTRRGKAYAFSIKRERSVLLRGSFDNASTNMSLH